MIDFLNEESQPQLSHLDEEGRIRMVDVGAKPRHGARGGSQRIRPDGRIDSGRRP